MIKKIALSIVIGFFSLITIGSFLPDVPEPEKPKVEEVTVAEAKATSTQEDLVVNKTTTGDSPKQVGTVPIVTAKVSGTVQNPAEQKITVEYYSVVKVVDGDTLDVSINGKTERLRLIGIDTPETVDPRKEVQCFGKEASNKAKELLIGKRVKIEKDSSQGERDKYDRLLAYIYIENGVFYNKYMIEQGYAHEYTYNTPYKYQKEFKSAQKDAENNQRGLWSPSTCSGNTTSSTVSPATSSSSASPADTQSGAKYYTSSYATSKYYYPESCDGWKSLSPTNLKSFESVESLLATYPSRSLSPSCL